MQDKVLVTGAAGFIGSHVVDALVAKKRNIRALVRENSDLRNIEHHISNGAIEVLCGDIRSRATVEQALSGCNVIINSAALTDLSASPDALFETNVHSLQVMLEIAANRELQRFVQISSIGAFDQAHTIINEDTPMTPISNYDRSKIEGERLAMSFWQKHSLPITILEPSAVYGPRVRIGFNYLLEVLSRGRMRYPVNEDTKLNMLYVNDLVQAVERAISVPEAIGERFIIGDEVSYSYREIIELMAKELGVAPPKKHIPFSIAKAYAFFAEIGAKVRGQKPQITVAYFDYITNDMILDISKAKKILGFKPEFSLAEGIKKMVRWFLAQDRERKH